MSCGLTRGKSPHPEPARGMRAEVRDLTLE
jgi:hypothetical protein